MAASFDSNMYLPIPPYEQDVTQGQFRAFLLDILPYQR